MKTSLDSIDVVDVDMDVAVNVVATDVVAMDVPMVVVFGSSWLLSDKGTRVATSIITVSKNKPVLVRAHKMVINEPQSPD